MGSRDGLAWHSFLLPSSALSPPVSNPGGRRSRNRYILDSWYINRATFGMSRQVQEALVTRGRTLSAVTPIWWISTMRVSAE